MPATDDDGVFRAELAAREQKERDSWRWGTKMPPTEDEPLFRGEWEPLLGALVFILTAAAAVKVAEERTRSIAGWSDGADVLFWLALGAVVIGWWRSWLAAYAAMLLVTVGLYVLRGIAGGALHSLWHGAAGSIRYLAT